LKIQLFSALDECQQSLESIIQAENLSNFRSIITSTKTHITYGLEGLANWFQIDSSKRVVAFKLEDLIDTLIEKIGTYYPERLDVKKDLVVDGELSGKLFQPLWELLFTLLENVKKHAKLPSIEVQVSAYHKDNIIEITIVNALGNAVDITHLESVILSAKELKNEQGNSDLLHQEGGSGFSKLHKILKYDLGCSQYDVVMKVADGKFNVFISLTLDNNHA
jgi:hypothetical protein